MFSQVPVCPHRGVSAPLPAGIHPPDQRQTPPGADTPPGPEADTPLGPDTPPAVHAVRYGQQAGGTHPTGMHTCFKIFNSYSFKSYENLFDKGKRATAFTMPRTHFTGYSCKVLIFIWKIIGCNGKLKN